MSKELQFLVRPRLELAQVEESRRMSSYRKPWRTSSYRQFRRTSSYRQPRRTSSHTQPRRRARRCMRKSSQTKPEEGPKPSRAEEAAVGRLLGGSSYAPHRPGEPKRQRAPPLREGSYGGGAADGGEGRPGRTDAREKELDFNFRSEGPKQRRIDLLGGFG
jgi:hypothetical protein